MIDSNTSQLKTLHLEKLHLETLQLETLQQWAAELGFQQVGISDIDVSLHANYLQQWLDNDYHGSMAWMQHHAHLRAHPDQLHNGTLRVISVRMDYLPNDDKNLLVKISADGSAYIARYTLGRDYHKLMRKRLAQLAEKIEHYAQSLNPNSNSPDDNNPDCNHSGENINRHRAFVDSAPVLERAFAEKSGLGWIGKNTMLINSTAGSYFFLGEILTTLPLTVTTAQESQHCGSCTACLDLCPTNAFVAPYQLDARRCISYLTIENRGNIPEELRPLMGNRIFGCDDCQAVCPWNKFAQPTQQTDFHPRHELDNAQLVELFMWNEETYLEKTEGSALRRIGYECWLRNIAVALGNATTTPDIVIALQSRRDFPSALVQEHVTWALLQHLQKN